MDQSIQHVATEPGSECLFPRNPLSIQYLTRYPSHSKRLMACEMLLKLAVVHKKYGIDMKSKWLLGFVVASALSAPAFGQIQIYIGTPPPPIRYEAPPPIPGEGFAWTAGFWEPHGPHYRWVPGRYVRAPYPGAHWTPARYEHGDKGWRMHQGYWEHKGNPHFDHDHDHGHGHDRD